MYTFKVALCDFVNDIELKQGHLIYKTGGH